MTFGSARTAQALPPRSSGHLTGDRYVAAGEVFTKFKQTIHATFFGESRLM